MGSGTPVDWAVEMRRFDETATLDHLAEAGKIDLRARRGAWARGRPPAIAPRRSSSRDRGSRRSPSFIEQNDAAFRETPRPLPAAGGDRARRGEQARFRARSPTARCARTDRPRTARARRSPSWQYRADRRQAGPVRRPRVRSADRGRRRALRSRLPAHGPPRARTSAKPPTSCSIAISRTRGGTRISTVLRRCLCSCRSARRSAPR